MGRGGGGGYMRDAPNDEGEGPLDGGEEGMMMGRGRQEDEEQGTLGWGRRPYEGKREGGAGWVR